MTEPNSDQDETIALQVATSTLARLRRPTTEETVKALCAEAAAASGISGGLALSFCLGTYGTALCLLAAEVQATALAGEAGGS